eukprot:scaffold62657_cov64-Phaeocystis_antarctica.AAC.7
MVVTLDVSKLSGWLNADACCRKSKAGHARRGPRCWPVGRRWRATAVQAACREGSTADWEQGTRGAHVEHVAHGCDAGRVEAQRLVEHRCAEEHIAHVCDAGRVEAQRLVERRRMLPRVKSRAYGAGRATGRRAAERCGAGGTAVQAARNREFDCRLGAGWGGAHVEHVAHFCDAGRVEPQWLVEHRRVLPRVEKQGMRGAGRWVREGGAGDRGASSAQGRARL